MAKDEKQPATDEERDYMTDRELENIKARLRRQGRLPEGS